MVVTTSSHNFKTMIKSSKIKKIIKGISMLKEEIEFKNQLISRLKIKEDFFNNDKKQNMFNLLYKYNKHPELIDFGHVNGFSKLYREELISIYKNNNIESVLSLFNFGEEFNNKVIASSDRKKIEKENRKERQLKIRKEKAKIRELELELKRKKETEERKKEIAILKNKYLELFNHLFEGKDFNYTILNEFLENNKSNLTACFEFTLNLKGVSEYFNLSKELIERLVVEEKLNKENIAKLKKWKLELIPSYKLFEQLNIKKVEFDRWREDGRIPTSDTKDFRKWGKVLTTTLHHPEDVKHITPELIIIWQDQDKKTSAIKRKESAIKAQEKTKITKAKNKVIEKLKIKSIFISNKEVSKIFSIPYVLDGFNYFAEIKIIKDTDFNNASIIKEIENSEGQIESLFKDIDIKTISSLITKEVNTITTKIPENLCLEEKLIIFEKIREFLSYGYNVKNINQTNLLKILNNTLRLIKDLRETEHVRKALQLEKYEESFPKARSIKREFNLIFGPTNSGKTYQALESLKNAKSGVYLAPLRLLAMEVFDKLNACGIPCNLLTGEEHILIPGAQHTASTVEMLMVDKVVEVAIIDEIQMLSDAQRGWAWTAAVVGVPAKKVFCIGSDDVKESMVLLLNYMNEQFSIVELNRQCPLIVEEKTIKDYTDLINGDVLIAFSRKEVLHHSNELKDLGFKVSTIYGALAPEVRRKQAELFLSGENTVMVSTDAIGMGLNLPAKRIIFSKVEKFDGIEVRELNINELKQIAGRAGRFGIHDKGYVSAFKKCDLDYIRNCLNQKNTQIKNKLTIAPSIWHIEQLAEVLNTKNLSTILTYFADKLKINHNIFETANLETMIELSSLNEKRIKDFSLKDKFIFSCVPLNLNNEYEINYLNELINTKIYNKERKLFNLPNWVTGDNYNNLHLAEGYSKELTIYAWLSYKYPEIYTDIDKISSHRKILSDYINRVLSKRKDYNINFEFDY